MVEMTTIKVDKPVVDWLNSIKGLLEWKQGGKYTLNTALTLILTDYDVRYAMSEELLDPEDDKQINEYIKKRLKQFWGNSDIPDIHWTTIDDFFKVKK